MERFTFIDLFAAPGGLSLGFEMAGFTAIAAVDLDLRGMETYSYNFRKTVIFTGSERGDVIRLGSGVLMGELGISPGDVDLVIGGPPCQGFSTVGRVKIASLVREGVWNHMRVSHPRFIDDPRNILYREFVRFVRDLRPKYLVMENVPGMMSYRNGEIVREIVEDFESIGYRTEARVLNAVDFGVPQERKRIFFIGNRLGLPNPFPGEGGNPAPRPPVTVWEAIGDLPDPVRGRHGLSDVPIEYGRPALSDFQRWAREWNGGPHDGRVHNHVARSHSERDVRVFSAMEEGMWWRDLPQELKKLYNYRDDIFHDKIKRLCRERPSWTVVAHLYKDGYMYVHPTQPRTITVREAARLQSFPDAFIFRGSRTDQFKQVGNAVPPLMAMAVAGGIRRMLEGDGW